jgi:serine/threonine protein kinase
MASVYRAYEPQLDRYVALKILPREFLHDPSFAERFLREARAIAKVEHPNIVPIYLHGIDQDQGIPWMAMRLVAGGSLSQLLKRERLALERCVEILRGVADALDFAHSKGIVHRDVKPQNVLLDESGRVYLADFGIAKMLEAKDGLTATGMITGTPQYMAPEQAMGRGVGPAADVYALGIVAYEMFAGHVPFSADTPLAVLMKHAQEPLPLPPADRVPEPLLRALLKCTAKKPADRWASAGAFVGALAAGLEARTVPLVAEVPTIVVPPPPRPPTITPPEVPPPPAPSTAPPRPGRPAPRLAPPPAPRATPPRPSGARPTLLLGLAGVGLAVVLLGTGLVAFWLVGSGPRPSPAPAGRVAPPEAVPPEPSDREAVRPRSEAPHPSVPPPAPPSSGTAPPRARDESPRTGASPVVALSTPSSPSPVTAATPREPEATSAPVDASRPTPRVDPEVLRLASAVGEGDPASRWRAAQRLGALGPSAAAAVPALTTALGDGSAEVRWRAAEALGLIGPPSREAVPALAQALGDSDPLVSAEAAKALGLLGKAAASAVPRLAEGLRSRDTAYRREAAKALARMGPAAEPALGALVEALKDKDRFVRAQAARAIGLVGPAAREAVPALTALSHDSELVVSREAQAALRAIAGD